MVLNIVDGGNYGSYTNAADSTLTMTGSTFNIGKSLIVTSGSTFPSDPTVTFDGNTTGGSIDAPDVTFNSVTINKGDFYHTVTLADNLTTSGNMTMSQGEFYVNGCTLTVGGAYSQDGGTFKQQTGTLNVQGNFTLTDGSTFTKATGNQALTLDGDGDLADNNTTLQDLGAVTIIGGITKTRTLTNSVKMTSLTISSGNIFSLNGNNFTFSSETTISNNNGTFRLQGNEVITNVSNPGIYSGLVEYVGDNTGGTNNIIDFSSGTDYYNLTINDANTIKNTFNAGSDLTIAGTFTLSEGTFTANKNTLLTNGLIGYWKLDNGTGTIATDSGTGGNNGTLTNMEEADWDSSVKPPLIKFSNKYSLNFDAGNEYVNAGDIDDIDGATALSVALWVKLDDLDADNVLISKGYLTANQALLLWRDEDGLDSSREDIFTVVTGDLDSQAKIEGTTGAADDFLWHHVVITYTGGSEEGLRLYVDGSEDTNGPVSTTSVASLKETTTPVLLARASGSGYYLDGHLDDVRIYNRVLSLDEIRALAKGDNTLSAAGTVTITVGGDLTISGGTFTSTSGNLNVAGNFNHSGGIFTHNNGTVILDTSSAATISGDTTFNDLTCIIAGKALTFEALKTQTIEETLTLTGGAGSLIILRSTTPGVYWYIDPEKTPDVNYVDVKDSNNTSTEITMIKPLNSVGSDDIAHNLYWFPAPEPEDGGEGPPPPPPEPDLPPDPPKPSDPEEPEEDNIDIPDEPPVEEPEEEDPFSPQDEKKKYKKKYIKGKYRTVVIVFEGRVVACPYDEKGPKFEEGTTLIKGQRTIQEGVVE